MASIVNKQKNQNNKHTHFLKTWWQSERKTRFIHWLCLERSLHNQSTRKTNTGMKNQIMNNNRIKSSNQTVAVADFLNAKGWDKFVTLGAQEPFAPGT